MRSYEVRGFTGRSGRSEPMEIYHPCLEPCHPSQRPFSRNAPLTLRPSTLTRRKISWTRMGWKLLTTPNGMSSSRGLAFPNPSSHCV